MARAKRKYQKSFAGALKHAKNQMAYSMREKQKVTDQGSLEEVPDVIVLKVDEETGSRQPQLAKLSIDESRQVQCHMCGRWCGPFARLGQLRRSHRANSKRGRKTSDSKSRNRSRGSPVVPR